MIRTDSRRYCEESWQKSDENSGSSDGKNVTACAPAHVRTRSKSFIYILLDVHPELLHAVVSVLGVVCLLISIALPEKPLNRNSPLYVYSSDNFIEDLRVSRLSIAAPLIIELFLDFKSSWNLFFIEVPAEIIPGSDGTTAGYGTQAHEIKLISIAFFIAFGDSSVRFDRRRHCQ
jgi:hypothetical protein